MSLMLLRKIENITDFEDTQGLTSEIRAEIDLIDCEDIIKKAKKIDKENYSKECFGISFNYVHNEDKLYLLGDLDNAIYYVDNDGNDNYFKTSKININNLERQIMIEFKKFLQDKNKYIEENNVWYGVI